jgi:hypothetical protein
LAADPSSVLLLARIKTNTRVMGVTTPSNTWVFTIRRKRFPGISTTEAPMSNCAVNRPRKSGASRKLLET